MKPFSIQESTREDMNFIDERLVEYNASHVPFGPTIPFTKINKHIKDEDGNIVAGINCIYYSWNCLYIDVLWVQKEYRNQGLGSKLLHAIEQSAREQNCHLIHLDTFDFQAKEFYLKHGYEIHGVLENCPMDHNRYYLKKDL